MMKSYLKKPRLLKLASIAFTMSFGVLAAPSALAVVVNGGFEQPTIPNGTWNNFTSIPGWSLSFGPEVDIVNNLPGLGIPYAGQNFIELDSSASSGIFQDVSTKPRQCYTLKFAISPRPNRPASDNKIRVLWNGSILDDLSAGAGGNSTSWSVYAYTVYASAGSTTRLEFQDTGPSNKHGMFLDAVSLENCDFKPPCKDDGTKVYQTDVASPSDNMLAAYPDKKFKGFGDTGIDKFFGHTFTGLNIPGKTIVGATLEIKAKAGRSSLSKNDALHLKFYDASGSSLSAGWGTYFGSGNPNPGGLLPQQWIIRFYQNGQTFNLNLANLKNLATAPNGGVSIINDLNTNGFLDVLVQDDTTIESVKLTVHYKCKFDVLVRDGIYDTGVEPSPNPPGNICSGWWCSRDIVVTNNNNPFAGLNQALPAHQNPVNGQTNSAYALVRNLGPIAANNVNVEFYLTKASTWGAPWIFLGSHPISHLPANSPTYLASIEWNPPGTGHYCMQVRLRTPLDPTAGNSVKDNNNIAQRNLNIVGLSPTKPVRTVFTVRPALNIKPLKLVFEVTAEKEADLKKLADELVNLTIGGLENLSVKDRKGLEIIDGKEAKFTGDKGSFIIDVAKGEEVKLNLTFAPTTLTQKDLSGKVYFHVKQFEGKELIGGVSYEIRPPKDTPLSVTLDTFTANAADGKVTINWTTGTETNNAGFTLWRATPIDGQCSLEASNYKDVKQVQPLVYSKSQDGVLGASYSEEDQNVEAGVTYCYGLEDVDYDGTRTFHANKIISATLN